MAFMFLTMKQKINADSMRMLIGVKAVTNLINNHGARLVRTFFKILIITIVIQSKQL